MPSPFRHCVPSPPLPHTFGNPPFFASIAPLTSSSCPHYTHHTLNHSPTLTHTHSHTLSTHLPPSSHCIATTLHPPSLYTHCFSLPPCVPPPPSYRFSSFSLPSSSLPPSPNVVQISMSPPLTSATSPASSQLQVVKIYCNSYLFSPQPQSTHTAPPCPPLASSYPMPTSPHHRTALSVSPFTSTHRAHSHTYQAVQRTNTLY